MSYILIADDDAAFSLMVKELLTGQGYEVDCANDASQFSAMLDKRLPHLVLSDMQMPGGGGIAAVRAVRARSPNNPIPVIVCTGMPGEQARKWFPNDPNLVILPKPLDYALLGTEVARLLGV
jgi:CheY-like chemotaxis protein